jgi:hypothetical protein
LKRRGAIICWSQQLYAESQQLEADLERDLTRWTELAERESDDAEHANRCAMRWMTTMKIGPRLLRVNWWQ